MTDRIAAAIATLSEDYGIIRRTIDCLTAQGSRRPGLSEIAAAIGVSEPLVREAIRRWAGLAPEDFLRTLTLERVRDLLRPDAASLFDTVAETGPPVRKPDLFVAHEVLPSGDFKSGRPRVKLRFGYHASPFGEALAVATERGLAGLGFVDGDDRSAALADMIRRWPAAEFAEDADATAPLVARSFNPALWTPDAPLPIVLIGTPFEVRVWEALLGVAFGKATTYSALAVGLGNPKAARAVGAAVGRNPISFVVPCHRVLGRDGALTGYHWGLTRKQAMLGWEAARSAPRR